MDQIEQGFWAEGKYDFRAYAQAYSAHDGIIWNTAVAVLLQLQAATGVRLQVLHMQTRQTVEMVRAAKAQGRPVTAEVNPWAFWLTNDWANIERLGPYALSYYVAPSHAESVWQGLLDGTVDMIATDHAPHTREEKEPGWTNTWKAHTGTPSTQHYLSLLLNDVNAGRLTLEQAVAIVSGRPAKVFGLYPRKGAIRIGADADIVAVDLSAETTITDEGVLSKCGWTPYAGRKVKGVPVHTLLRGQFVFENGKVVGKPGYGKVARRAQA
jgi:dihydroorotase